MPNTRHRRFSVKKEICKTYPLKNEIGSTSYGHPETRPTSPKIKSKTSPEVSRQMYTVTESESSASTSTMTEPKFSILVTGVDKDINVNSRNIDSANSNDAFDSSLERLKQSAESELASDDADIKETSLPKRDRHLRQHRIKVRSPKCRMPSPEANIADDKSTCTTRRNATTNANWEEELKLCGLNFVSLVETVDDMDSTSNHSMDDMCRICHGGDGTSLELGELISACSCRGTVGRVHVKCLERWLTESGKSKCELCGTRYATRRVHRYGVPRALVMWVLSQNAKQLMVDSLGIVLMSPLAVLAAWLSGRTLAGLMTQDKNVTPWPLASTFVLACMTLVCYYCWIVSAATRHALGWWLWYRSQYEVRLQLQDNEE